MTLKRTLPFFMIILIATGCFRQSSDTFDTVDSGSSDTATQVIIAPTATEDTAVTIIAVDMDDLTPTVEATVVEAEEPTIESADAESADDSDTPTEVVIQPTTMPTATDFPEPTEEEDSSVAVLPTATTAGFITPEPVVAVENPTAVPTVAPTRNPALQSTPSDEETSAEDAPTECEYVVQSGDNLFRIALNNNVTLEDLLAENELTENSIIQPGQQLLIPGCEDESDAEATVEATEDVEMTEAAVVLEDGFRLHTVVAGETLLTIAREYGVTVNDILNENTDITNPNRIVPGQELLIPPADE